MEILLFGGIWLAVLSEMPPNIPSKTADVNGLPRLLMDKKIEV